MSYIVTPDLGLELPDPLTIQPFETVNVNSNFLLLEAGIVADGVRLSAVEPKVTTLEARVTHRPADLDALAAIATGGLLSGDLARVTEGGAVFVWTGAAWLQVTKAVFANAAARNTAFAKASAAYRPGAVARVSTEFFDRVYSAAGVWNPSGPPKTLIAPSSVATTGGSATITDGVVVATGAVTVLTLQGAFDAAHGFERYQVEWDLTTSAAAGFDMALAAAGVAATDYDNQRVTAVSTTVATVRTAANAAMQIDVISVAGKHRGKLELSKPHLAEETEFWADYSSMDTAYSVASGRGWTNGRHDTASAYDGLVITRATTGNFNGSVKVFGLL